MSLERGDHSGEKKEIKGGRSGLYRQCESFSIFFSRDTHTLIALNGQEHCRDTKYIYHPTNWDEISRFFTANPSVSLGKTRN